MEVNIHHVILYFGKMYVYISSRSSMGRTDNFPSGVEISIVGARFKVNLGANEELVVC